MNTLKLSELYTNILYIIYKYYIIYTTSYIYYMYIFRLIQCNPFQHRNQKPYADHASKSASVD